MLWGFCDTSQRLQSEQPAGSHACQRTSEFVRRACSIAYTSGDLIHNMRRISQVLYPIVDSTVVASAVWCGAALAVGRRTLGLCGLLGHTRRNAVCVCVGATDASRVACGAV